MAFKKATKKRSKLRLAFIGPSGSGKTYSALKVASGLGKKIALIDTEGSSASLYADEFSFDEDTLRTFHPREFIKRIKDAEDSGYDVLVIDSLSHAWFGTEGALELVNKEQTRSRNNNSFTAWRNVTPLHNQLVNSILQSKIHIIATMRAKEKYVMEEDGGKNKIKKLGLEAIQRDGLNYEFTIVADMDMDHNMIISKTRMKSLDGAIINRPGVEFAQQLIDWLDSGEDDHSVEIVADDPVSSPPTVTTAQEATPESDDNQDINDEPAPEVDRQVSNDLVKPLLEKAFKYLTTKSVEPIEDTMSAAKLLIGHEFGVENVEEITDDQFEDLQKYLRGPLIKALKADSFI